MKQYNGTTRIALFGAAPDTPNMGVTALFMSVVTSLSRYFDSVEFIVFDNGLGRRYDSVNDELGNSIPLILFGARGGYRLYRPENLHTMLILSRLGKLGSRLNEGIRLIDSCQAVLDISGGDSFSDIYGVKRFNNINIPKIIATNREKNLFLLPQTYGPYKDPKVQALAKKSVDNAAMSWARDENSFAILKYLLGKSFVSEAHLSGVDVAFLLQPVSADEMLDLALKDWIDNKDVAYPLVGINVSGLIYNDPDGARSKYGFKSDYKKVLIGFISMLIKSTDARIVLISHVMDKMGHYESDIGACMDLVKQLSLQNEKRVIVSPATLNQSQAKWLISQMDWFCGTRMHSTIAGLSSCVPTASISYSDKTKGVFKST